MSAKQVTVLGSTETLTLVERVNRGFKPCPGEAHTNAHIDHCTLCAPKWGKIVDYLPVGPDQCPKGFAVPCGLPELHDSPEEAAFIAAEKAGEFRVVFVKQKNSWFGVWTRV